MWVKLEKSFVSLLHDETLVLSGFCNLLAKLTLLKHDATVWSCL